MNYYDVLYQKADDCRARAAARLAPVCDNACVQADLLWTRIAPILLGQLLSAERIFTILLLSIGIAIGAGFSDFFRKHRWAVVFVIAFSVVLFLYHAVKLMVSMEASEDDF